MATLDWPQCPAIESVPDSRRRRMVVFKKTRMPVSTVFENFEVGASIEEIIEQYDVTREEIQAVLAIRRSQPRCAAGSCWRSQLD